MLQASLQFVAILQVLMQSEQAIERYRKLCYSGVHRSAWILLSAMSVE